MGREEHAFVPHHPTVTAHKKINQQRKERSSFRAEAERAGTKYKQKTFEFGLKITSLGGCYSYSLFTSQNFIQKTRGFCAKEGNLSIFLFRAETRNGEWRVRLWLV
jgi:hypothetical protein